MQLVTIAPGHQLAPLPAASALRMFAAGCPRVITSSWRSSAHQAELRALYLAGRGAFALPPGKSLHERGYAVDWKQAAATWVRAHPEHGWRFTNPDEWWHAEYVMALDRHAGETVPPRPAAAPAAPAVVLPPPRPHQEDDMIYRAKGSRDFIFDGWTYLQGADGVLRPLSAKEYQARTWADPEVKIAEWSADDLYDLALRCGIYAFTGTIDDRDPFGLTGAILGRNATVETKGGRWG